MNTLPMYVASGPGWVELSLPDGYSFMTGSGRGWLELDGNEVVVETQGPGWVQFRPRSLLEIEIDAGVKIEAVQLLKGVPTHELSGTFRIAADRFPFMQHLDPGTRLRIEVPPIIFQGQFMLPSPMGNVFTVQYDGDGWNFKPREDHAPSPFPLRVIPSEYPYKATLIKPDGTEIGPLGFIVEDNEALLVDLFVEKGQSEPPQTFEGYLPIINSLRITAPGNPDVDRGFLSPGGVVTVQPSLMSEQFEMRLGRYPSFFTDTTGLLVRTPAHPRYAQKPRIWTLLSSQSFGTVSFNLAHTASASDHAWLIINSVRRYRQFQDASSLDVAINVANAVRDTGMIGEEGFPFPYWFVRPHLDRQPDGTYAPNATTSTIEDQAIMSLALLSLHAVTNEDEWLIAGTGLFGTVLDGLASLDGRAAAGQLPFWAEGAPYARFTTTGTELTGIRLSSLLELTLMLHRGGELLKDRGHVRFGMYQGHNLKARLQKLWTFNARYRDNGGADTRGLPYTHFTLADTDLTLLNPATYSTAEIAKLAWASGEALHAGVITDHPITLINTLYGQGKTFNHWHTHHARQDGLLDRVTTPDVDPLTTIYVALARQVASLPAVSQR